MNTAIINVKVEPKVKLEARAVAEKLGISLSSLIHAFLKQLILSKTVTFSAVREEPSDYFIKSLKEAQEDVKAGRVKSFDTPDSALKYLDKMIENDKKNKKN